MDKTQYLKIKIATIISFLVILNPDKISLPNGIILTISFIENLFSLFSEKLDVYFFMSSFTFISIFTTFFKNNKIILLSISIQYMWLIYMFKVGDKNYWYYIIPTLIYLVLSLILIYLVIFKNNREIK